MHRILLTAFVVACSAAAVENINPSTEVKANIRRNGKQVCLGVLVGSRWVVTLSDCVDDDRINQYKVIIGGKYKRTITSKQMMDSRDSVALLSLSKMVKVKPAIIAKPGESMKAKSSKSMSRITGNDVDIDVIPNKKCLQKENYNRKRGLDLCYNSVYKKNSCSMVAGSPIFSYNFQRWSLLGLALESTTCHDSPTLGVDLTKYRAWIHEVLNEPIPCSPSEFRCSDGTCISNSKVCDGQMDCPCAGEEEHSCGCSALGQKFVLGFNNLRNLADTCDTLTPFVYLTSTQPTAVQIDGPNITVNVSVDGSKKVIFPLDVVPELRSIGNTSNYGIEITSDNPITVVAVETCEEVTDNDSDLEEIDGTLVFPDNCMSNEYVVDVYTSQRDYGNNEITIVGIEPETNVSIITPQGDAINAVIDRRQTLFFSNRTYLVGSIVIADKNIAVFAGNDLNVLKSYTSGTFFEQMPPLASLGKVYIASIIPPSVDFVYRITGAYDNTEVTIRNETGGIYETLRVGKGEFYEFYVQQGLNSTLNSIIADHGILVTQYETSQHYKSLLEIGDPCYVVLPALTQCESEFSFTLSMYMIINTVVVYISECYGTEGLRMNGAPVSVTELNSRTIDIPDFGRYTVLTIDIVLKNPSIPTFTTLSHNKKGARMCANLRGVRRDGSAFWRIGGLM